MSAVLQTFQHPADQSFALQFMLDVQKSIGALTKSVEKLEASVSEQSGKIDRIRLIMAGADAVHVIVGVVFFQNND